MGFCKIYNNCCIDFLVGKYYILLRSYCFRLVYYVEMFFYLIIVKGKIGEREERERDECYIFLFYLFVWLFRYIKYIMFIKFFIKCFLK